MAINNISVFCASSTGYESMYTSIAYELGAEIARRHKAVVYGGAKVGLMGAVARGAIENKGKVYGVIPQFLKIKELEFESLTHTYIVETMHERKAKMNDLCDAVIALPGGFGTLDELFEMITWGQLALHQKPIGLLNIDGYYNDLLSFIDNMIGKGFVKPEYKKMLVIESEIINLLEGLESYKPINNDKWFKPALS